MLAITECGGAAKKSAILASNQFLLLKPSSLPDSARKFPLHLNTLCHAGKGVFMRCTEVALSHRSFRINNAASCMVSNTNTSNGHLDLQALAAVTGVSVGPADQIVLMDADTPTPRSVGVTQHAQLCASVIVTTLPCHTPGRARIGRPWEASGCSSACLLLRRERILDPFMRLTAAPVADACRRWRRGV